MVDYLKNEEFTKCSKRFATQQKSRQRTVKILCLLQYIFSKQKQDPVIPFPTVFCYGSNSGVGSYTSVISRAANRKPTVNACNSCRSETSASAFSSCSSSVFCCSVRVARSFVSSCATFSINSSFVTAGYVVFVRIDITVINIFKDTHGFHPFPSQTTYHRQPHKSSIFYDKKGGYRFR